MCVARLLCVVGVSLSVLCGCVTFSVCCVGMVAGGHNVRQCSHLEALES